MTDSPLTEARVNEMLAGLEGVTEERPAFIRLWTAPFYVTMDGIKDANGCWICDAKSPKLAAELVELMNFAAAVPLAPTIRQLCEAWRRDAETRRRLAKMKQAEQALADRYAETSDDYTKNEIACKRIGMQSAITIMEEGNRG